MKTTIDLPDELLEEAEYVARREGVTVPELVEQALRMALKTHRRPSRFKLRDASVGGTGMAPDLRDAPWSKIRDLAYGLDDEDKLKRAFR